MELTQRLECTQEQFTNNCEKSHAEQIGFLGICGAKYPLRKGPNKIGRDPETCNIVLHLNSISRQHAVINILNNHDFMLMDLGSANKTKLANQTLQPYIPLALKNGDVVQFGEVFGVFRLLEEENDLPMTQAIGIPETPVQRGLVSKLNNAHATTVPESPEVSDRDDSFIAASQQKSKILFKSPNNNNFLKSSGKNIAIKSLGTNEIDNVFWRSSKKSDSFSMQSTVSNNLNNSLTTPTKQSIHELDTQVSYVNQNNSTDSIYNANTQIVENPSISNIYDMETQLPITVNLLEVCKKEQENVEFNFCADNKENDNNIFNAETQVIFNEKPTSPKETEKVNHEQCNSLSHSKEIHNVSDDIILFDEIDCQLDEDNFESQPLLLQKLTDSKHGNNNAESQNIKFVSRTTVNRLKSDSSTDCEDINTAVAQDLPRNIDNDDVSTDCEDEPSALFKSNIKHDVDDDVTDCEDNLNDSNVVKCNKSIEKDNFEDLPTQILDKVYIKDVNKKEEAPTQIIADNGTNMDTYRTRFEEALTQQIYSEEIVKFKVPLEFSVKKKKKDDINVNVIENTATKNVGDDDGQYYNATQELFDDLCSQRSLSPEVAIENTSNTKCALSNDLLNENQQSINNKIYVRRHSPETSDVEERINEFVSNLSSSQIRDVVGAQKSATILKMPSDNSEVEATPKKINCLSVLETELPNTQEIKTGITLIAASPDKESISADRIETESDSECTAHIKHKHNAKRMNKIKINLSDKFDPETLPTRTSARVRKPTSKLRNCGELSMNSKSIHNPILIDEKPDVAKHSIKENIYRKRKSDNVKSKAEGHGSNTAKTSAHSTRKVQKETKTEKNKPNRGNQKQYMNKDKQQKSKITVIVVEDSKEQQNPANNSCRLTRSNRKQNDEKSRSPEIDNRKSEIKKKQNSINKKAKSAERENSTATAKRKLSKEVQISVSDNETEIRRSKRNKTTKNSEELLSNVAKSNAKSPIDQSTVYSIVNMSSDSSMDSPNKLKRKATSELEVPSAKKSKSGVTSSDNPVSRVKPFRAVKAHCVLFTAFPCEEVKDKLVKFGAVIVSDVKACTVVLTMQIKRTFKLLCAVGLGKPIVGPNWVQACADARMIVDPWLYLIKDEAIERRFKFDLKMTLIGKREFLRGYNVSSTPNVLPGAPEMKLIVECSGGKWKEGGPNWICVSAPADKSLWAGLRRRGAVLVLTEFILGGVLRQKLDIERNKL